MASYLKILQFIFLLLFSGFCISQDFDEESNEIKCGTMEQDALLQNQDPSYSAKRSKIQNDIQDYIKNNDRKELDGDIIVIPVVFHCVYDQEEYGEKANIDELYLYAQLDQLNDDFRRLNTDADDTWSQAADIEIEFCLASEDPNGNSSSGILRHQISNGGHWSASDFNAEVKPITIWDRDQYLNIWVTDLQGLLGYAQFPGGPADTDGIVLEWRTVGSLDIPGPRKTYTNSYGRTATHEVGHWLDLYHIWGDDGNACTGSDMCDDTPNQAGSSDDCPSGFETDACSPSSPGVMYQNYMDYTDDLCTNLFTEDQKSRMIATLNGSRSSLLTASCGGTPPVAYFVPNYDNYEVCEGDLIDLFDFSSGDPDSWSWSFSGAGANPISSNLQHPSVAVNATGTLTVTLTATNENGSHSFTKFIDIISNPIGSDFCNNPPCLDYQKFPIDKVNYSDVCFIGDCYLNSYYSTTDFNQVKKGEGYFLGYLEENHEYTFEFCEDYDPALYEAFITIGKWNHLNNSIIPNYYLAYEQGCSITFVADEFIEYVAVITEYEACGEPYAYTPNGIPTMQCTINECTSVCGREFVDSGGPHRSYLRGQNKVYVLCPDNPSTESITTVFTNFDVNAFQNHTLTAYDGDNISAPLIDIFDNNNEPTIVEATGPTGCLTYHFISNTSTSAFGWRADIYCGDPCPANYSGANALTGTENGNGGLNMNGDFETDGEIESTQIINSGNIDYDSGTSILLNPGFETNPNANFDAFIDGCNNGAGGNTAKQEKETSGNK